MPPLYPLYLALAADIEPAAKATHSPPPQAAGQPERFSRTKTTPVNLFLYDVTSSYVEGTHNALAAFGYNRDGKKGSSAKVTL